MNSNSTHDQRQRLLEALKSRSVTTFEARSDLDICHPAARVEELRKQGIPIETHWTYEESMPGRRHRIASYVLMVSQQA